MEENAGEREGEARQEFQSLRDEIKNKVRDILFAMEENPGEREGEARQEFQSLRDEIKNKVRARRGLTV